MEDQLKEWMKLAKYVYLHFDGCTEAANMAILLVYMLFEYDGN